MAELVLVEVRVAPLQAQRGERDPLSEPGGPKRRATRRSKRSVRGTMSPPFISSTGCCSPGLACQRPGKSLISSSEVVVRGALFGMSRSL